MKRREFLIASSATVVLPWLPANGRADVDRLHDMFEELAGLRTRPNFVGIHGFESQDTIGFETLLDHDREDSGLERRIVKVPKGIEKPQWLSHTFWEHFENPRGRAVVARLLAEGLDPQEMAPHLPYMGFDYVSSEVKADGFIVYDPQSADEFFDDITRLVQRKRELHSQGFKAEHLVYPYSKAKAAWYGYRCSKESRGHRWQVMLDARVPYWEDWYDPSELPGFEAVIQDGFNAAGDYRKQLSSKSTQA